MDNYLELVTLVMGFSLHLDDKEEIIATVLSIKGDLFEQNDDEEYYGLNILKDGIAVTYANGDYSLRMENLIKIEKNGSK